MSAADQHVPSKSVGRPQHLAPLDGIRGIGVVYVLMYHHGTVLFGRRLGEGLTVSTFFTLSGYLITRLLVNEFDRTGRISLGTFYNRRFKRLMPAALIALLLIAQVWWLSPSPKGGVSFWSWFSALTYWQNWFLIFGGNSYNDLFTNASPLQHMWSLSIEEQVYIVFPLIVFGILRSERLRARATTILATLTAVCFATGWFWTERGGASRAYYALETRSAEFLIGAAFAVWWMRSSRTPGVIRAMRTVPGRAIGYGLVGFEVLIWYCIHLDHAVILPDWGLFPFWAIVNGVVVCLLAGFAEAKSGADTFLSWRPFTFIGSISYGMYLIHWPVFLVINEERVGLSSWPLFAARSAVTVAITLAIYYLIEDPVRRGNMWKGRTFTTASVMLAVTGLGFAAINPGDRINDLVDTEALAAQERMLRDLPQLPPDAPTRSGVDSALPARVLFVGDSQSWTVGGGMDRFWGERNGVDAIPSAGVGCGIATPTRIRYLGEEFPTGRSGCKEWRDALPAIVDKFRPQLVVIVGGFGDLADRQIPGVKNWTHIGQPDYDTWLTGEMDTFVDEMTAAGAHVLWLSHPYNSPPRQAGSEPFPEEDPLRMDLYNEMIESLATADERVEFGDLAAFLRARPGGEMDTTLRPDGAHIDLAVAPDLVDWLAEEIRRATAAA